MAKCKKDLAEMCRDRIYKLAYHPAKKIVHKLINENKRMQSTHQLIFLGL